jgi:hypothetical protein
VFTEGCDCTGNAADVEIDFEGKCVTLLRKCQVYGPPEHRPVNMLEHNGDVIKFTSYNGDVFISTGGGDFIKQE